MLIITRVSLCRRVIRSRVQPLLLDHSRHLVATTGDDFGTASAVLRPARDVGRVVGGQGGVGSTETFGGESLLTGTGHGWDDALLTGIARNGGAFLGHVGEVAALVRVRSHIMSTSEECLVDYTVRILSFRLGSTQAKSHRMWLTSWSNSFEVGNVRSGCFVGLSCQLEKLDVIDSARFPTHTLVRRGSGFHFSMQ